jgi:hypothetical protein
MAIGKQGAGHAVSHTGVAIGYQVAIATLFHVFVAVQT